MPITKELNNIRNLEAVGLPHEQAEALTDIIEQSHVDSQQGLKEFIHSEIANLEFRQRALQTEMEHRLKASQAEMEHCLKTSQTEMELRLKTSQTDLLIKFSGIIAGFISAALAIAKLLW